MTELEVPQKMLLLHDVSSVGRKCTCAMAPSSDGSVQRRLRSACNEEPTVEEEYGKCRENNLGSAACCGNQKGNVKGKGKEGPGWARNALAGSVSGIVSRATIAPFDVIKIRMQLQVGYGCEYSSMSQSLRLILEREGVFGLFKGSVPATALWGVYTAINLPLYSAAMHYFEQYWLSTEDSFTAGDHGARAMCSFIAGSTGTAVATVLSFPLDTIRTQWVFQGKPAQLRMHALVAQVYRQGGPRGFYHGITPALAQVMPHMGLNFLIFDGLKHSFLRNSLHFGGALTSKNDDTRLSVVTNLIVGGTSGFLSKLAVYPLDTAKRRLQVDTMPRDMQYAKQLLSRDKYQDGLLTCLRKMAKEEGVRSWFKGIAPTLFKASITTAVTFSTYEKLTEKQ